MWQISYLEIRVQKSNVKVQFIFTISHLPTICHRIPICSTWRWGGVGELCHETFWCLGFEWLFYSFDKLPRTLSVSTNMEITICSLKLILLHPIDCVSSVYPFISIVQISDTA